LLQDLRALAANEQRNKQRQVENTMPWPGTDIKCTLVKQTRLAFLLKINLRNIGQMKS